MSVSAEWVQLGKGKKGKPVYYRKKEIYAMEWTSENVNLSDCLVCAATYGGPIAITRDPRKMLRVKNSDGKQYIYIYTCAGKLLSKFEWLLSSRGSLIHIGFSDEEALICVSDDGQVFLYDLFGKTLFQFSFVPEVKEKEILKVTTWGNGVAILTKDFHVFVVSDLDAPYCEKLSMVPVVGEYDDEKEIAMCVIPPEQSTTNQIEIILGLPQCNTIYLVNSERCTDMKLNNGPFAKINASPSGDALATFTEDGALWVVKSDFTENHAEFNTKSAAPPHQVAWCGEDSVCLYWEPEQINREGTSLLLMIGPNGDHQKFAYEGPIFMVTEIDGVRIITNDGCEFLQRVPDPSFDIFRIGSLTPSAVLYDAYTEFEKKNASSIKNIRSIRMQLSGAVKSCLEAAAHEFDHSLQRKLLKAASYGKSFCEDFDHSEFVSTCQTVRVMNAVREYEIPITFAQYQRLTPKVLIDRLVNRQLHYLAYRLCDYLRIKPASV
ncbi:vacuolar protein-sorting protein VPS16, partial [Acrasis kona]